REGRGRNNTGRSSRLLCRLQCATVSDAVALVLYRWMLLRSSEQSGGKLAIDADEWVDLLALGIGHHRHGLVHHEQAEIGDVLANVDRQSVVRVGGRYHEDRPELAIVEQRRVELGFLAIPAVDDCLQACRRLE